MSWTRRAVAAVWEFIVGDDWRTAVGVVLATGAVALLAAADVAAWWVLPSAVPLILWFSLRRALAGHGGR